MPGVYSADETYPGGATAPVGDSRLLKLDNRGTCQACHDPTGTITAGQQVGPTPRTRSFPSPSSPVATRHGGHRTPTLDGRIDHPMKRTNGSLARRARPLFVVATLVFSVALAFTPGVPTAIALSPDPSAPADPGQSPAPDPTPAPTPDPTPSPMPDPTAAADAGSDAGRRPRSRPQTPPPPDRRPDGDPGLRLGPDPTATPPSIPRRSHRAAPADPGASPTPVPDATTTPAPTAAPTPAPTLPPPGPRALVLDATKGQYATVRRRPRVPPGRVHGRDLVPPGRPEDRRPGRDERRGRPRPARAASTRSSRS